MVSNSKKTEIRPVVESVSANLEHSSGMGEDAEPVNLVSCAMNSGALATFDGMGGAGSAKCELVNGEIHTEAYLASRYIRDKVSEYIANNESINENELSDCLASCLNEYKDEIGIQHSGLRSSIIKTLPTTAAILTWKLSENSIDVSSYWAGDSRNYVLTSRGQMLLSKDHVRSSGDALYNLHHDPPMTNCISQSHTFYLDKISTCFNEPIVLISCTDGCFGYLNSPIHFEKMLLETMERSSTIEEWKDALCEYLTPVSGDDFSFAIQIIGTDFVTMRDLLKEHANMIDRCIEMFDLMVEHQSDQALVIWELYAVGLESLIC